MQTRDFIVMLLVNQQPRYKELVKDLVNMKSKLQSEDPAFAVLINEAFRSACFEKIADDITKELACSTEDVYSVLEDLSDVEEYLNV
jgi:hypothetical protein